MQTNKELKKSLIVLIKPLLALILGSIFLHSLILYNITINPTIFLLLIPLFFISVFKNNEFKLKTIIFPRKNLAGLVEASLSIILLQYLCYKFLQIGIYSDSPKVILHSLTLLFLSIFINAGIEEFVFRVTLFEVIKQKVIKIKFYQILLSSLIFGLYHLLYYMTGMGHFLFSLVVGLTLSYIYSKTYNFFYVSLLHAIYNFCTTIIRNSFPLESSSVLWFQIYGSFIFIVVFLVFKKIYIVRYQIKM